MAWARILEPEVMDSTAEAVEYDAMDHREVNGRFVDDLLAILPKLSNFATFLDLGTGTARIPIELCSRDATTTIVAADLSLAMLSLADQNIKAHGFADRIKLAQMDATRLPYPDHHFNGVISNSIIHHLPEPSAAFREAVRVTESGGILFFRDLVRPANAEAWQELVTKYAARESERARQLFADSLRASLTVDEVRDLVQSLGFEAETVQMTSDRHWTWSATTMT